VALEENMTNRYLADMINPVKWIKRKIADYKYKKRVKAKLKKLAEQDPYIYD
jgi:hypothetical protein